MLKGLQPHKDLLAHHLKDGGRFQNALANFILTNQLETVVETGSGISSLFILEAMDIMGKGHLYSIDPEPYCGFEIEHERYTLIKKKSFQALGDLYKQTGQWDLFLHDSDHWIETQMFEYRIGYECLRNGGWIFSDDCHWGGHKSWWRFIENYNLEEITLADISGAQKTEHDCIEIKKIDNLVKFAWGNAKNYGKEWRKKNGEPPCWSCEEELTNYWEYPKK